jgi:hypothetical protein
LLQLGYGIIGLVASNINAGHVDYFPSIVMGVSGMIGFSFSCLGGITALKRKSFLLSLTSAILAFPAEFAYLVAYGSLSPHGAILVGVLIVVPVIVFSLLGLVLVAYSAHEIRKLTTAKNADQNK